MLKTEAPDKRPAVAFDSKQEVLMVITALKKYRDEIGVGSYFVKIIDEFEKLLPMFEGGEK